MMSNRPSLVTVIIPAYNAERWIRQTLHSATAQTHRELEVLVIDDGSTDRTAEIAKAIAREDPRVTVVCKANGGVAAARNTGIELARGEFIAPLDADDLWHPQKIEKQLSRFHLGADAPGLVYCWSQSIDEDGRILRPGRNRTAPEGFVFDTLLQENFVGNGSAPLIPTRIARSVGGYHFEVAQGCEDWTFYLFIAAKYPFGVIPEHLVGYRRSPASMSKNFDQMHHSHTEMLAIVSTHCPGHDPRLFRNSETSILLWMLSNAQPFSRAFFDLIRKILRRDPLICFRPHFLRRLSLFARTRCNECFKSPVREHERPPFLQPRDRTQAPHPDGD